jgi:hypothetical protein
VDFSFLRIITRALVRPRLLAILLATGWRFRRRGWYRRPPFLPLPPDDYMRWRMHTAYGDERHEPSVTELETYLRWAARMRKHSRIGDDA